MALATSWSDSLSDPELPDVLALVGRAALADGVGALDEQQRLDLRHPGTRKLVYVVARDENEIVGFALAELSGIEATGAVVVDPDRRRRGIGTALAQRLVEEIPETLRIWAHGNLPGARRIASRIGFEAVRELRMMRLDLSGLAVPLAEPRWPDGVTLRTFEVGHDEDAWVRLNAAAFADHPEQGRLTRADLDQRMAEPWFDPAGFFLAERDGELLGFHWTKLTDDAPRPSGEIYVLGIAAEAQGLGLGKALALAGLHHLEDRGVTTVDLYVEASNPAAIGLYTGLGFRRAQTDVLYEYRPA